MLYSLCCLLVLAHVGKNNVRGAPSGAALLHYWPMALKVTVFTGFSMQDTLLDFWQCLVFEMCVSWERVTTTRMQCN